jgi:spore maturation protein CgeB
MKIVFLGLSVTSSWGNGHATNYRALMKALAGRGHNVAFLERDVPWYASQRDMPDPPWGTTHLYGSLDELRERHSELVRDADLVVVGSYVPEGVEVGHWVCDIARGIPAFYDIDTPVTLSKLERGDHEYLTPELIGRYRLYLSFTGGPTLERLERGLGSPSAHAFYCLVDPDLYYPEPVDARWDLGYLGTYSADRQPALERLLLEPARRDPSLRCVVAGPQYPDEIDWPENVERIEHLPPAGHRAFYCAQRFTINVTRADMVEAGWSPSVRLFEAAACATAVISDWWEGLDAFFTPCDEIVIAASPEQVIETVRAPTPGSGPHMPHPPAGSGPHMPHRGVYDPRAIGARARERVLAEHTADRRVAQLEELVSRVGVPTA